MGVSARIIGCALLTSGLAAWAAYGLFHEIPGYGLIVMLFGCVGAIVGAVAGAAEEIVAAQRRTASATKPRASEDWE